MLTYIDKFLNSITMYRLVLMSLRVMVAYSLVLAFFGMLSHGFLSYVYSVLILVTACWCFNYIFSKLFKAPVNIESAIITALILYFILFPVTNLGDGITAVFVSFVAMASKYFLTINKRHIFNPVAIAAFVLGLTAIFTTSIPGLSTYIHSGNAMWWVGTPYMLPVTLIIGFLIVRKIRKFTMFFAFVTGAVITTLIIDPTILAQNFLSWPIIFFGTIMLTEPFTMPPRRKEQIIFGLGVGLLFTAHYQLGPIYSTPEFALILGNIFAYAVSMKRRVMLTLKEKRLISKDTYEFSFAPDARFENQPGQYLEWTLPGDHADNRGNRRYFTVASSPTESDVKIGIKFYTPSSTFKTGLGTFETGQVIAAGQLGGDFTLLKNQTKKLVLIAGGIGVTPFRSMIKYLSDKGEKREVTLIYSVKTEDEIAYKDIFEEATNKFGLKVIYLVGNFLTEDFIKKEIPEYGSQVYYLSGPNAMVENYKKLIRGLGVRRVNIKTDYFPGF